LRRKWTLARSGEGGWLLDEEVGVDMRGESTAIGDEAAGGDEDAEEDRRSR
jgi:hypothetical protein